MNPDGTVLVVAGVRHESDARAQLASIGVAANLILEPIGRDSAAAMAAAALSVRDLGPETILVFAAADHHIPDDAAFRDAVLLAADGAAGGRIVTLGVKPTHASTAYGYIEAADRKPGIQPVARFVEKPQSSEAEALVAGGYLWNSGNFVASLGGFLEELAVLAPETLAAAERAVEGARCDNGDLWLASDFALAPKISIDYAVMEKTRVASVLPVDFIWSDLGAWDAIWALTPQDERGNASGPSAVLHDASGVLIKAPTAKRVAVVGLRDLAVVVEGDDVLVCSLAHSQEVKTAAERWLDEPHRPFADLEAADAWFDSWLRTAALPLWWALGADHERGGFHETLSLTGVPCQSERRVRVQARQAIVYAKAGVSGWAGPWRQAAWHGVDYLFRRYMRPDGLYRSKVAPDGAATDDRAYLYDQAFVLLALASLQEAEPDRTDLAAAALALRRRLEALKAPGGGYFETDSPFMLSNPHMHLLECALAWAQLDSTAWSDLADEVAQLALGRMFNPKLGVIHETYDADWSPAPGPAGRVFWSGHQFEWAWLLERWGRLRGDEAARAVAARLFESGVRTVDQRRGVAVGESQDDFSTLDPIARLWPQTERLKAALWFGQTEEALAAANSLKSYLTAPSPGLWRERLLPDGGFRAEAAPASSFYHVAGALSDLHRWVEGRLP